ncbi:MAG: DMT family transporter [Candidimonas sp.]|nr:MAG: DMT family transporter [Candidimonas sp.]TAM21496.1 MAG: DMT family transporter [Candidimonas sp.]TAM77863.1 MAG: DMT family transporter [Candidimonas sp.]
MAFTVLLWGFSWIVMKDLSHLIGPFDLVTLRYGIGFLVLFVFMLASRQSLRFPPFWLTLGIALFQTTAFQCLAQFALIEGGTGQVVMLSYTMAFWVLLFAWMLLGDKPTRQHVLGFVLAAAGLLAVIAPWEGMSGGVVSSLLALSGGASWGLGVVLAKMLFRRYANVNVLSLTAWQMFLGTLFTLPLSLGVPQMAIHWGSETVVGLLYMGVMASAVGWVMWMMVVQRVSTTVAGMSSLGVPVLAIIFAWLLLNERPTALEIVGVAFMLAGLVVVTLAPVARKKLG